jgi:hypothetical protein
MSVSIPEYTLHGHRLHDHLEADATSDAENAKHLVYSNMIHLAITLYAKEESSIAHRLFKQQRELSRPVERSEIGRHEERRNYLSLGDQSRDGPANTGADPRAFEAQGCFRSGKQK